jgi:hypothetical protein
MTSEEYVWNFAFGSNMSSKVLKGRRKIKPLETVAAKVKDWRVTFFPMIPYFEPGMGTIERYKGAICHGVLVKLTTTEFDQLYASEGGPNGTYKLSELEAEAYDGRKIKAIAFEDKTKLPFVGKPSARYMGLLIEGATEYKLDEKYIEELKSYPTNPTSLLKKIILFPFFAPFILPIMIIILISEFFRRTCGVRVNLSSSLFSFMKSFLWVLHDYIYQYIFGEGGKWDRK